MIQNQVIPIHFGKGVDTKTDSKMVVLGRLLRLQDGVFTAPDQVDKRNGYGVITNSILGGGTITSPQMVRTYQNELVCADSILGQLYSYSPTQSAWVPKGNYVPTLVSSAIISRYLTSHIATSSAAVGNIILFTRQSSNAGGSYFATVVDLASGTTLISDYLMPGSGTAGACVRPVVLAGNTLGVVYINASSNPMLATLNISAGNVFFNAPVQINSDVVLTNWFTVAPTATGAVLTYRTATPTFKIVTLNSGGTVLNSASQAIVSGANSPSFVSVEPATNNVWAYWYDDHTLSYAVYSSILTPILAATTITTLSEVIVLSFISISGTAGIQTVIYSGSNSTAPGDSLVTTYKVNVQSNGTVGSPAIFVQNAQIYSQVFTINGAQYVTCVYPSLTQATYFVLKVSDGTILAKALSGTAIGNSSGVYISAPTQVSATKVIIPCQQSYSFAVAGGFAFGSSYFSIDSGSTELYQSLSANGNLVLNGGQISSYDGKSVTELGYHLAPSIVSATAGGVGSMDAGTYLYYFTYIYTDEQGNVYESSPSVPATIAVGASGSVDLVVSTLGLTAKNGGTQPTRIRGYRTTANGTVARLFVTTLNTTATNTITVHDGNSDASMAKFPPIYTTGGVVSNSAPPPAVAMCLHNNRVWLVPSDSPNQTWYSQTMIPTVGVNFSPFLLQQVDSIGGGITAIAGMDDKLAIFEESAVLVMSGDGAGPTGLGSTLSNPQVVPSDTGCNQSKGVITIPLGVIFKSPKGLYLLDRGLNIKYLGIDVEAFNSQDVTASTMIAKKSQVRFLTSSGLTLVYDYIFGQWSTFTNHQGYSADIWQGQYVYARTDGSIFQEKPGYYLDNATPYGLLAQTAYLNLAGVQGFQRVRRIGMLGNYANGATSSHGVQVSAAYNYNPSMSTPIAIGFGGALTAGPFQYRERLPIQKCESVSFLIQEIVTGNALESVSFSDLSLEVGVKSGLNRQSAARTVG